MPDVKGLIINYSQLQHKQKWKWCLKKLPLSSRETCGKLCNNLAMFLFYIFVSFYFIISFTVQSAMSLSSNLSSEMSLHRLDSLASDMNFDPSILSLQSNFVPTTTTSEQQVSFLIIGHV